MNIPDERLIRLTYIIYGLHLFSALSGLLSPALVITSFLTGWPSILALIINYVKYSDVRETYLESHFRWQIRTFWFTLLWFVIAGILFMTLIAIPLAFIIFLLTGLWVLYRLIRGLRRLMLGRSVDDLL
jgi:uncharacterized membrane protein